MYNRAVMSDEEQRWRQRDDARTLAQAEAIKADKERYAGAIVGAKEIAKEELERVQGIAKVAGMKTPKLNTKTEPIPQGNNSPQTFDKRGYRNPAYIGRL